MTEKDGWSKWVGAQLLAREAAGLLRSTEALLPVSPVRVRKADGEEYLLFSSNDYLGLSGDERVVQAVQEAVGQYGLGPRGSPLVCGYTTLHEELEQELARWKKTAAALLCPTGFAANQAVLGALGQEGTEIFSDALNHASIIDGIGLARRRGATLSVYEHRDVRRLGALLARSRAERKLVVTDAVFSMDGDLAPLGEIAALCEEFEALLVVDEAHGSFVFGEKGEGLSEQLGVSDRVDLHVGTLSKGAGGLGGFVATSSQMRTLLLNQGRSYIYSTAAPLSVVAGVLAVLEILKSDEGPLRRLWERVEQLGSGLGVVLESPIVALVLGDEERALKASEHLRGQGIEVSAIRPPTVAEGTSRLRVTVSAAHSAEDIERLVGALKEIQVRFGFEVVPH